MAILLRASPFRSPILCMRQNKLKYTVPTPDDSHRRHIRMGNFKRRVFDHRYQHRNWIRSRPWNPRQEPFNLAIIEDRPGNRAAASSAAAPILGTTLYRVSRAKASSRLATWFSGWAGWVDLGPQQCSSYPLSQSTRGLGVFVNPSGIAADGASSARAKYRC